MSDSLDLSQLASRMADLFVEGNLPALSQAFSEALDDQQAAPDRITLEVYLALYGRGLPDAALGFAIMSCAATGGLAAAEAFARKIHENHDKGMAVNLMMHLLSQGSKEYFIARTALDFLFDLKEYKMVTDIYEKVEDVVTLENTEEVVFCNVIAAYDMTAQTDKAVALLTEVRSAFPESADANALLYTFASNRKNETAFKAYFETLDQKILSMPFVKTSVAASGFCLDFADCSPEMVIESVNQHGLCYLKGAIHQTWCAAMLERVNEIATGFPARVELVLPDHSSEAYRFDPAFVMKTLLGREARYDPDFSFVRNVRPDNADSFLPYHQDTTAFGRLIANVWAPLTPAGGDYPSLEFVRKRITINEQTMIQGGRHGVIEIEEAYVQEKYGDLRYEVADARPGDCVIFLGTTIHRSANLRDATLPRYNAELRWS